MKALLMGTLVLGMISAAAADDEATLAAKWAANSTVVFKGTVKKVKGSTFKSANVLSAATLEHTLVVLVDELVEPTAEAKKLLGKAVGTEITVYDKPADALPKLKEGDKVVFFASGWLYSDTVAVRTVGRLPVAVAAAPPAGQPVPLTAAAQAARQRDDAKLAAHLENADTVVVGKVVAVRPLREPRQQAVSAASTSQKPVSEHDPLWKEAVVEVQSVEKGRPGQKRVVVVFAASRDVVWYKAPKFKKDQEGVLVLHKRQIADGPLNQALLTASPQDPTDDIGGVYTAIDPRDFIPAKPGDAERVRRMLGK